jgi:hypothetical protein
MHGVQTAVPRVLACSRPSGASRPANGLQIGASPNPMTPVGGYGLPGVTSGE